MAKPATKSSPAARRAKAAAQTPEPAVMAAGASLENKVEGKGSPPAESPTKAEAPEAAAEAEARESGSGEGASATEAEGFRDEKGHFTGNPPTDAERLDALCDLAERNGWSLPKILRRPKE
jgi:hypothetical protein